VADWKDRLEDDGAIDASESSLHQLADAVVGDALLAVRVARLDEDVARECRAQLVMEMARVMRLDLKHGAWRRLATSDRRQLRRALLLLARLMHSRVPIPVA
jgi:hypothetical protein